MGSRLSVLAVLLAATITAASAAAEPVRVAPTLDGSKSCAKPEYPALSRRLEEQGSVVLRFLVGPEGVPIRSEIVSSSGFERLDQAAQAALSLCHFKPGTIDGQPAPEPGWAQLRYTWNLQPSTGAPLAARVWEPKCSAQPSVADFAGQLAEVAAGAKIGGTLRFVVPSTKAPVPSACHGAYLRAEAEALRKAGLFDRVELDESGVGNVRPQAKNEDYTFWLENAGLTGAYRGGPRVAFGDGRLGLAAWSVHVAEMLKMARDMQDPKGTGLATTLLGLQPYFAFHGREYLSTADLEEGVRAAAASEAKEVPSGPNVAGRVRLILVPEATLIAYAEVRSAQAQPAELHRIAINQLAWNVTAYALAKGWSSAVTSTGMFKTVDIEEANFPDPLLSGYDAVVWNEPSSPYRWKVRDSSGAVHELPATEHAADWIAGLRAALADKPPK